MGRAAMIIGGVVLALAAVGEVVLTFLLYREDGNEIVRIIGWVIVWLSAIFGWLPILTFRRRGGVPRGRSYMQTTVLVDRGIYTIVRHPQYLAGVLLGIGLSLIAQHWLVGVLGAIVVIESYLSTYPEEQGLRKKFGAEYDQYARRVPRMNFALGLLRLLRRKEATRRVTARERIENVTMITSDCGTGLPEESVDVVLLYDIFHDLSRPDDLLRELCRVLKADGLLSFSDHHMDDADIIAGVTGAGMFDLVKKGRRTYSFAKLGATAH